MEPSHNKLNIKKYLMQIILAMNNYLIGIFFIHFISVTSIKTFAVRIKFLCLFKLFRRKYLIWNFNIFPPYFILKIFLRYETLKNSKILSLCKDISQINSNRVYLWYMFNYSRLLYDSYTHNIIIGVHYV